MITTNSISNAVASVIDELQIPCMHCMGLNSYKLKPCQHCEGRGWNHTKSLHNIITNIKYPLTLVLKNDMIGWSAEIAIDGTSLKVDSDRHAYNDPVDAVYEALFEALTDKLGASKVGEFESKAQHPRQHNKPKRTTRGRGRPIKSVMTVQESVKWLQPGSES